jgi:hypothetical protein
MKEDKIPENCFEIKLKEKDKEEDLDTDGNNRIGKMSDASKEEHGRKLQEEEKDQGE